jgi:hypothetical protein
MHASQQLRCRHGMTIMHFDASWHTMHALDFIPFVVVDVVTDVDGVCFNSFLFLLVRNCARRRRRSFVSDLLTATLTSRVLEPMPCSSFGVAL